MSRRTLTPATTVESLKKDAKRWLKALRAGDSDARAEFYRWHPDGRNATDATDATDGRDSPGLREVQHALALMYGFNGWIALTAEVARRALQALQALQAQQAQQAHAASSDGNPIDDFIKAACLDWRIGGSQRRRATSTAGRLLARNPEIANVNIYTALACGELEAVRNFLDEDPMLINHTGGPREWPLILYLCSARLPDTAERRDDVAILKLLLDRGADACAFYPGGNADIHYTAFTCVMGRGEEQAEMHPRARAMVSLLLEHGADPFDGQVLYNVFAGHASQPYLDDGISWLLELMHETSIARGRGDGWSNPEWPMFGARFMLGAAVDRNLIGLAKWMLEHGAGPNATWGKPKMSQRSLHEEAMRNGYFEMATLLEEYGAVPGEDTDEFLHACLRMDRDAVAYMIEKRPEYLNETNALFAAARLDRDDVVGMLLDLGMSPDVADSKDSNGRALHEAAYNGAMRVAALLIERGAEVDPVHTYHDAIPLGMASFANRPDVIELIGRYSRDVWELVYTGCVERITQLMTDDPAIANTVSSDGSTPLMWLPDDEDDAVAIAELFMKHGADPARVNDQGVTAADIADGHGMDRLARVLRER